jgi:hypothetical protein
MSRPHLYTTLIRRGLLLSEGPISPTDGPSPAKTLEAVERVAHSHKVTVDLGVLNKNPSRLLVCPCSRATSGV